jgi:hypothetical protein
MIAFGNWILVSLCISQVDARIGRSWGQTDAESCPEFCGVVEMCSIASCSECDICRDEGCQCAGWCNQWTTDHSFCSDCGSAACGRYLEADHSTNAALTQIADLLKSGDATVPQAAEWLKKLNAHSANAVIEEIDRLKEKHSGEAEQGSTTLSPTYTTAAATAVVSTKPIATKAESSTNEPAGSDAIAENPLSIDATKEHSSSSDALVKKPLSSATTGKPIAENSPNGDAPESPLLQLGWLGDTGDWLGDRFDDMNDFATSDDRVDDMSDWLIWHRLPMQNHLAESI